MTLTEKQKGGNRSMIYTIGYQHLLSAEQLIEILRQNRVTCLLDVRSRPYGRKPVFNKNRLEKCLPLAGIEYYWKGKHLGGFSEIKESSIKALADFQKNKVVCIMCMEADPDKCHRKYEIARRLKAYGVEASHLTT